METKKNYIFHLTLVTVGGGAQMNIVKLPFLKLFPKTDLIFSDASNLQRFYGNV